MPRSAGRREAIAQNLREMSRLGVPVIVVVIGEGGSGGALALGVGNRIYMMENAVYSVISPESCAAIIYRDSGKAPQAAAALKMTAPDLLELRADRRHRSGAGRGRAHRSRQRRGSAAPDAAHGLSRARPACRRQQLIDDRYEKFRRMGSFFTEPIL